MATGRATSELSLKRPIVADFGIISALVDRNSLFQRSGYPVENQDLFTVSDDGVPIGSLGEGNGARTVRKLQRFGQRRWHIVETHDNQRDDQ